MQITHTNTHRQCSVHPIPVLIKKSAKKYIYILIFRWVSKYPALLRSAQEEKDAAVPTYAQNKTKLDFY